MESIESKRNECDRSTDPSEVARRREKTNENGSDTLLLDIKENCTPTKQGVTTSWKVTEKRVANLSFLGTVVLEFSPPNHAENVRREKLRDKEHRQTLRQRMRKDGDVYYLSPIRNFPTLASIKTKNDTVPAQTVEKDSGDKFDRLLKKIKEDLYRHQHKYRSVEEKLEQKQSELKELIEETTALKAQNAVKEEQVTQLESALGQLQQELDAARRSILEFDEFSNDYDTIKECNYLDQIRAFKETLAQKQVEFEATRLRNDKDAAVQVQHAAQEEKMKQVESTIAELRRFVKLLSSLIVMVTVAVVMLALIIVMVIVVI
jgi:hypothetical protein